MPPRPGSAHARLGAEWEPAPSSRGNAGGWIRPLPGRRTLEDGRVLETERQAVPAGLWRRSVAAEDASQVSPARCFPGSPSADAGRESHRPWWLRRERLLLSSRSAWDLLPYRSHSGSVGTLGAASELTGRGSSRGTCWGVARGGGARTPSCWWITRGPGLAGFGTGSFSSGLELARAAVVRTRGACPFPLPRV